MIIFKITDDLLKNIRTDLARRHPYAVERVGFLLVRQVRLVKLILLLAVSYHPIPDEQYIDDSNSGARIDSQAIRGAMQLALDTREGIFHIHQHVGSNIPRFSLMDREETPPIIASLQNVSPESTHGMIVINDKNITGLAQMPNDDFLVPINKIVVVGFPIKIINER